MGVRLLIDYCFDPGRNGLVLALAGKSSLLEMRVLRLRSQLTVLDLKLGDYI